MITAEMATVQVKKRYVYVDYIYAYLNLNVTDNDYGTSVMSLTKFSTARTFCDIITFHINIKKEKKKLEISLQYFQYY